MSYLLHSESELRNAAEAAVEAARKIGAEASVTARSHSGARISVRNGAVDSAVRDSSQGVRVTVYRDGKSGAANTASLEAGAITRAVSEADTIARAVEADPDGGLPDPDWLAPAGECVALYEADCHGPAALVEAAMAIDAAGTGPGRRVTDAGAASSEGIWALATSAGFSRSNRFSNRGRWCLVMAGDEQGAIVDSFESSDRRDEGLDSPEHVAGMAVERALRGRNARPMSSRRTAALFEPRAAASVIGDLVGALTGAAQHRKASFLRDPVGQKVAAEHLDLAEDPFETFGLASGEFDSDGIAGSRRFIIEAGVARGLFLGARTARQLGQKSTGNADGPYNLKLTSRNQMVDRAQMLNLMGTGLIVSQLSGGATDPLTGSWTRAVSGFWVENGEIAHPVRDVTLAGEMKAMLGGITALGSDVERFGPVRAGPVLIDQMQLGGAE